MPAIKKDPRIEVRERGKRKLVQVIKISGATARKVEMVMRGLLRNMDTERFVAIEVDCPK